MQCAPPASSPPDPTRPAPAPLVPALFLLLALAVLTGCGEDPPGRPGPLPAGRLVGSDPVACGMSRDWSAAEDGRGWELRGIAEIPCWLGDAAPEGLTFRLVPDAETEDHRFRLLWDGEPLGADPATAGAALVVEVPEERLTPGSHSLTLEQAHRRGDGGDQRHVFTSVQVSAGASSSDLGVADADRLHYLADFLLFGSTGADDLKVDGVLLDGPGSAELELPTGPGRRLRLRPENASSAPAHFRVEVDGAVHGVAVEPHGRGRLEVALPAGADRVTLAVEGSPRGLFLLGAPRLVADERPRGVPPVILITLDTTRRDALGAYGAPPGSTPNLDRFAETATVYDAAVSTTSWTLPSHASMFTGLYPSRHGAGVSRRWLPPEPPNLARLLRARGLVPLGVAGGLMTSHQFGMGRDFAFYRNPRGGRQTPGDQLTDLAVGLLDETRGETPFLFANYFDPHAPYAAPEPFPGRSGVPAARSALRDPLWRRAAEGDRRAWAKLVIGEGPHTEAGLAWARAAYRAEVAFMDHQVGRLFDALRRRGLWDDALVVVVSDHGELLGDHGYLTHGYRLDAELVEVPLLVKEPGQREGRRSGALVSVADLFPTLLAIAGVEAPASDGRPLGRPDPQRRHVLFEEHRSRVHPLVVDSLRIAGHLWGLQGRRVRQVVWEGGAQCQRRSADGWRTGPCPGDPERVLSALQQVLGTPPGDAAEVAGELSEKQREALRALGYL